MNPSDPTQARKTFNENHSIPSVSLIPDPREGRSGMTWIANVKGEKSIFVDEQNDKDLINKIQRRERSLPRVRFTEGTRKVEDRNIVEIEYLRHCSRNADVAAKMNKPMLATFFEYKPETDSSTRVEKEIADIELKGAILALTGSRLLAVARVSGALQSVRTEVSDTVAKHKILNFLRQPEGRKLVESLMNDEMLEYRFDIQEALDKGHIKWDQRNPLNLLWQSGGLIATVPAGTQDKVQYAASYLFKDGFATLNTIRKLLHRISLDELVEETGSVNLRDWLKTANTTQISEKMLDWHREHPQMALFEWKGPWAYFDGVKLAKGTEETVKTIVEDSDLFDLVYKKWTSFIFN